MKKTDCDILVVGAGPAGGSAALAAAQKGASVMVVDRKTKPGVPVRCGEYIPAPLVGELNLGRSFLVQKIKGMRTYLPEGGMRETRAPGFIINRDIFDRTIVHAAKKAGASIVFSTRVIGHENGRVILKGRDGRHFQIYPGIIIGADGPHSTVGKWAGLVNQNLLPAIQARVALKTPLDVTEVFFEKSFYGGYGWLFPKGSAANAGVGFRTGQGGSPSLKNALSGFLERLKGAGKIQGQPLAYTFGWIPVQPLQKMSWENMILAGDAAGHAHPITGAGIAHAVMAGRMAGSCAARAEKAGDVGLLSAYEEEWSEFYGPVLRKGALRRKKLESEWHRLDTIIKTCWTAFREYHAET